MRLDGTNHVSKFQLLTSCAMLVKRQKQLRAGPARTLSEKSANIDASGGDQTCVFPDLTVSVVLPLDHVGRGGCEVVTVLAIQFNKPTPVNTRTGRAGKASLDVLYKARRHLVEKLFSGASNGRFLSSCAAAVRSLMTDTSDSRTFAGATAYT